MSREGKKYGLVGVGVGNNTPNRQTKADERVLNRARQMTDAPRNAMRTVKWRVSAPSLLITRLTAATAVIAAA